MIQPREANVQRPHHSDNGILLNLTLVDDKRETGLAIAKALVAGP